MSFKDEDILKDIFEQQQLEYIENGDKININGTLFEMGTKIIGDDLFSILLPKHFGLMKEDEKEEKYPSKYRPQTVFTNEDTSMNFTFSYLDISILSNNLKNTILGFKSTIKKMHPTNTFYDTVVKQKDDQPIAYFDYRSDALDDEIYNIMFITIIEGKLLLGTFSCIFQYKDDYKSFALRTINSIKEIGAEDSE